MPALLRDERSGPRTLAVAHAAVLIGSPRAQRDANVRAALERAGVAVAEVVGVDQLDADAPLGSAWGARGIGIAVAAGGDGTIGSVATQIAGSAVALGILPLGTSNDTARSLGLPLDLTAAAEVIANGVSTAVDAGRVLATSSEMDGARGVYFLHAMTLGMNVEFARLATDLVRRRRWGRLNYAAAALEAVTRFEPLATEVTLEGVARRSEFAAAPDAHGLVTLEQHVMQIAAVNLPIFGGGLNLELRDTALHDQLLDLVMIEAPSLDTIRAVAQAWFEARRRLGGSGRARSVLAGGGAASASLPIDIAGLTIPGVTRYQARAMTVNTPRPVDVTLDGEIRTRTPLRVEAAPGTIRVMLPSSARSASNVRDNMVR